MLLLREFVKFVILVNVSSYLLVATAMFIEYALTLNIKFLVTSANGLSGLLFGFLVAFKQMVPEHTVNVFKIASVRVKYIPSLAIAGYIVLFLVDLVNAQLFIILSGTLTSWVYIRFFKQQDGIRGDRSETFSFASFFPEILHPFIAPVSNATFHLFVALRLLPPLAASVLPTTTAAMSSTIYGDLNKPQNPLGSDTADAERRRALALRALDKRLAQNTSSPAVAPPQNASSPDPAVPPAST
ncbi:hypothetical protein BJ742DRAFT_674844 [Cladochytrium replicatum]|nr:hypothetical protein BJ742DRAFT_674844 [Cladochytrium replicatum]